MKHLPWVLCAVFTLIACGDSEESSSPSGSKGGSAGKGGASLGGHAGGPEGGEGGHPEGGEGGHPEGGEGGEVASGGGGQPEGGHGGEAASGGGGQPAGGQGGEVASGGGGQPEGGQGGGGFGGAEDPCPSDILCGMLGECCDLGEECIEGACVPACLSNVRCSPTLCCEGTQVCLAGDCVTPGEPCGDSFDCDDGYFCEPTLGQCLPQVEGAEACQYKPPVEALSPILEWSWTESTILPEYNQIQSLPLVADFDGDKSPDVVIATFVQNHGPAHLRLLDGRDGTEKWPSTAEVFLPENAACPATNPAVADINGDGHLEVVSLTYDNGLMAVDHQGNLLWKATMPDGVTPYHGTIVPVPFVCNWLCSISVARMDSDDQAEIVVGGVIFNSGGIMLAGQGGEIYGYNGMYGPISIIADVDSDGTQDVVTGAAAFRLDGSYIWGNGLSDGYTAIADLDGDGAAELVVTSLGNVRVQNAATGEVLAQLAIPGGGPSGGPPTVADFDGDGTMDFAAAGANLYSAFSYVSEPSPTIEVMWSSPTYDVSPGTTGSSVFDFDGDGASEVVYNDEVNLLILNGADGAVRFQAESSSLTGAEYPVVVDVDGDNNTELLTISAFYGPTPSRFGLFVYGDEHDRWVRTRKIWNQHSYHITNVNMDGSLPVPELQSWAEGSPNNYRVSASGAGMYNAPDLKVDLELSIHACPTDLVLRARVKNEGSLGVPAGVVVKFYEGTDATGTLISEQATTQALLPGQSEVVEAEYPLGDVSEDLSFYVAVEGALSTGTVVHECESDNNDATGSSVGCPGIDPE